MGIKLWTEDETYQILVNAVPNDVSTETRALAAWDVWLEINAKGRIQLPTMRLVQDSLWRNAPKR